MKKNKIQVVTMKGESMMGIYKFINKLITKPK